MILKSENLRFAYPGKPEWLFPNLSLPAGEALVIRGASGRGKTTWMHLLAGLLHPTSGAVSWNGREVFSLSPAERDRLRGRELGLLFQLSPFFQALTLSENMEWVCRLTGISFPGQRFADLLEKLGLSGLINSLPSDWSAGESQRIGLLRAVLTEPGLLLADEPTSHLDDDTAELVINLLTEYRNSGHALLLISHDHRLLRAFPNHIQL